MYGMTPVGVFFTAIFPLEINEQALCQQPQLGPKRRVWGGSPTSRFSQTGRKAGLVKMASVDTEALLAIYRHPRKAP